MHQRPAVPQVDQQVIRYRHKGVVDFGHHHHLRGGQAALQVVKVDGAARGGEGEASWNRVSGERTAGRKAGSRLDQVTQGTTEKTALPMKAAVCAPCGQQHPPHAAPNLSTTLALTTAPLHPAHCPINRPMHRPSPHLS